MFAASSPSADLVSSESQSWESVSDPELELVQQGEKMEERHKTLNMAKITMIFQMVYITDLFKKTRIIRISTQTNQHEMFRRIVTGDVSLYPIHFTGMLSNNKRAPEGIFEQADDDSKNIPSGCIFSLKHHRIEKESSPTKRRRASTTVQQQKEDAEQPEPMDNRMDGNGLVDHSIRIFLSLLNSGIDSRIYFVLNDRRIDCFLEYQLGSRVVEATTEYSGNIFSIDRNFAITDQTPIFSKKTKYHRYFLEILTIYGNILAEHMKQTLWHGLAVPKIAPRGTFRDIRPPEESASFIQLDAKRLSRVPDTMEKLKIHPRYTAESICRKTEFIHPKRLACGTIKGEAVYPRSCCRKLRSVRGWYMQGRALKLLQTEENGQAVGKNPKPYRMLNKKPLYSEFQTVPIVIYDLLHGPMEYFHDNFIPVNCVYMDTSPSLCEWLSIEYSRCIIGLRPGKQLFRGVFVQKEDEQFVRQMARDYQYYAQIHKFNSMRDEAIRAWRIFIRKIDRYLDIREHVGLDGRDEERG